MRPEVRSKVMAQNHPLQDKPACVCGHTAAPDRPGTNGHSLIYRSGKPHWTCLSMELVDGDWKHCQCADYAPTEGSKR